jgi:hypothetical protein
VKFLAVKGFDRFQHYRDRNPPWIKLHGTILTDLAFLEMPEAAQAQLVKLWVLASQLGHPLPNNPKLLAGKIGTTGKFHLATIIAAGFLVPCDEIASSPLADLEQKAKPSVRARTQRGEIEVETAVEEAGEPAITAIYLAVWTNGAIAERWGEQPAPLTPASAIDLAASLNGLGVHWQAVKESIYRQCRNSRASRPPSSVNYFRRGVEEDWARAQAKATIAAVPNDAPPEGPSRPPAGGGARRSADADTGRATLMLGKIRGLARESQQPGQALRRFIPRKDVEALGADVLAAYEAIGGAARVLAAEGETMGFVIRDFARALDAQELAHV